MSREELFGINKNGAEFSDCRKYRYALWRIWDESKPLVMFIGLNPSTANEVDNDPTIKSVCRIANNNGYGGIYMMNCFPIISANPNILDIYKKPVWDENEYNKYGTNNLKITEIGYKCKDIVFAWGNFKIVKETYREIEFSKMFPNAVCLHINKNGSPKHPLYCKSDTQFINWKP